MPLGFAFHESELLQILLKVTEAQTVKVQGRQAWQKPTGKLGGRADRKGQTESPGDTTDKDQTRRAKALDKLQVRRRQGNTEQ